MYAAANAVGGAKTRDRQRERGGLQQEPGFGTPHAVRQLRGAIAELRPGDDRPPAAVPDFWDEILRMTLDGWAEALERDLRRASVALDSAAEAEGAAPSDDQVAAVEECLWRLASASDKIDVIISLAFGGDPFVVVADKPTKMTMRPSRDRNNSALKKIGSENTQQLVEARAALAGERSRLRRHQLMHSLAPINALADIGVFIRVHHRDGRIFGYELLRWSPERWDEGINALTPEDLFAQRTKEARSGLDAFVRVIDAVGVAIAAEPVARVPQYIYYDHDVGRLAIETALSVPARRPPPPYRLTRARGSLFVCWCELFRLARGGASRWRPVRALWSGVRLLTLSGRAGEF